MKRIFMLILIVVLIASTSYVLFAKEHMGGMMDKGDKPMMGMCPKCAMMGKCMTYKQIAAVEDGGLVVIVGNTLMKYDKDLNMVKQVEIEVDMEKISQKITEMAQKCPMCSKMKDDKISEKMYEYDEE